MSTTVIPLKIYFPTRGFQIGVAAKSLQHLRDTLQAKLGLSERFKLTLDDGTIVCDPEYFKLLEHQTKLNVIEGSPNGKPANTATANEANLDAARKRASPSTPSAAKRARHSPESRDKTDLNTNQNNSQLLSRICISSVAGNVPMSESPKPANEGASLSTVQQQPQKQLQSIPQQLKTISYLQNVQPQHVQNVIPLSSSQQLQHPQQLQNTRLSLQHLRRKPTGKTWPDSVTITAIPQHPQSTTSPLLHTALQRPQGPPFTPPPPHHQIIVPSNQPHAFPGSPSTPLSAPPMITPPPIQWLPRGTPIDQQYLPNMSPFSNVIHPQSPHCPPGGILYPCPGMPMPMPMPMYQPRPTPQQLTRDHIYQMQLERQMRTTIRMSPSPIPLQTPMPQPIQPRARPITVAQTPVIQPPINQVRDLAKPAIIQQAPPSSNLPDGTHTIQQVVELLQVPTPSMVPSTPPALLKVICSKSTNTGCTPTADLSSNLEAGSLQATKVVPEDTDSEDEHTLQIVVCESETLPSPPPPRALSSPESQASSSPSRSPIAAEALSKQKPQKPTELSLVSSQIDDGYCSATTSSLGSADDVKRALPFASFDDFIPLHSCYAENKEDPQENNGIVSIVPQDKCTCPTNKDDSTVEHEREDTDTLETEPASEDFENKPLTDHQESMVIALPIKLIDGQIYYDQDSGDKIKLEPFVAEVQRDEVIFIDSEPEDCDSDVSPIEHFVNQGTPNSFHLSLDEDYNEIDTDVDMNKSVESKGSTEDIVVAEHGAEVPVVTTPLDCTMTLDLNKCVADIMGVVNSKERELDSDKISKAESPHNCSKAENLATVQIPPSACLITNVTSTSIPCSRDGEVVIEESVLIDSSSFHQGDILPDELVMGNEVVLSLEGSSQALDYLDSNELISNLLLHSCLPQNGCRVSLS